VKASEGLIARGKEKLNIARGTFKGASVSTDDIVAAGWGIKEKKWLTVYNPNDDTTNNHELKPLDGIFPSVPSSPVFPSGIIGLKNRGSELFERIKATALLYGSEITGWDPVPIVLARLGLSEELAIDLDNFPSRWQIYCNGWGHWGLEGEINKDAEWFFRTNTVRDVDGDEKLPLRMWPFRHMSMESMSVLSTAMNESLLQSYDGILRIFPAFPDDKTGRFTLHAVGGFVVSSEIREGEVQWVSVKSLLGNPCRLELPWSKAVVQSNLKKRVKTVRGEITEIKTKAGEVIVFTPEEESLRSWSVEPEKPQPNEKVKYHPSGKTQLGIPRMF
ncbi:glycoside hydrolase family 95-like protein, partial [Mariniphaga sediminis]|uniref:glycoside hydrolase family 95-like protein n=1 Tax=Mariniphaga sediminis TaxID=1628158 RepID=UPI0035672A8A